MRGDERHNAQRRSPSRRTLLSQAGCGARGNQTLGACFFPAGSSEERSNCRRSPQSRAWLAGAWKRWVCFLFNRLHLGAWGRACWGASGTAGISRQPAGPPTHPCVVAGSHPPVGPAAPLVALNHRPRALSVSLSPLLKSEPEEGRTWVWALPCHSGRAEHGRSGHACWMAGWWVGNGPRAS